MISTQTIENWLSYSGKTIIGCALEMVNSFDEDLAVVYADVGRRFGLSSIRDKCYEVGISEQSMIGIAAGLACNHQHPFAISYAPFITSRVADQLRVFIGDMLCPIRMLGAASGFCAADLGAQLMALEDISITRSIPHLQVVCPADNTETVKVIIAAAKNNKPIYIRLTGGKSVPCVYHEDYDFVIGKAVTLHHGTEIGIISTGTVTYQTQKAVALLEEQGFSCTHLNMHTVKPLDIDALDALKSHKMIVTVEEHSIIGGLGSAVAEHLSAGSHPPLLMLGVKDTYYKADSPERLLERAGLTADGIAQSITAKMPALR